MHQSPSGPFLRVICDVLLDYVRNSSIHGIRFIVAAEHLLEKIFWATAVIVSLSVCSGLIHHEYTKWSDAPISVTFADWEGSVWDIPFPAVTLCVETKLKRSMVNYTQMVRIYASNQTEHFATGHDLQNLMAAVLLCDEATFSDQHLVDIPDADYVDLMYKMSPLLNSTLFDCWFMNRREPCDSLFREYLTEDGFCFTFNSLSVKDMFTERISPDFFSDQNPPSPDQWALDTGYTSDELLPSIYPLRAHRSDLRVGLTIGLMLNASDVDYTCREFAKGFRLLLHSPVEVPRPSLNYIRIPTEKDVQIAVEPNLMYTDNDMRGYTPTHRHCFFDSERSLGLYRVYTQLNCEYECLANFTLEMCGCVHYGMPHFNTTPVCGAPQQKCLHEVMQRDAASQNVEYCQCLPECTVITYDADISDVDLDWRDFYNESMAIDQPGMILSRVSIFFKRKHFMAKQRKALYRNLDFVYACGGFLSLFIGVSLMSFVEVVYFFTLRMGAVCVDHWRRSNSNNSK